MYSNKLILDLLHYIDKNLYKQITTQELSDYFFYNKAYIMRLFKREIGTTIIGYILRKRVYLSLKNLEYTNNSILYISLQFGFSSQEYYSETFRRFMSCSPSTFRKFTKHDYSIHEKQANEIRNSLVHLNTFFLSVEKYSHNVNTHSQTKILSIFQNKK